MKLTRFQWMAVAAAMVVSAVPGFGQQETLRVITRFKLKAGTFPSFEAAVKDEKAALAKMGYKVRQTWWTSVAGPQEVVVVRYFKDFAAYGEPGPQTTDSAVAAARGRAAQFIDSTSTQIERLIPELSTPVDPAKIPAYVRRLETVVKTDRLADYKKLLKDEVAPVIRKIENKMFMVSEMLYGGDATLVATITGMDSMAEFDQPLPLVRVMGQAAYDTLIGKRAPMVEKSVVTLYRHRPEMSYLP